MGLQAINLPCLHPLDELMVALGGSNAVAEMTGRKGHLAQNEDGGLTTYQKRAATSGVSADKVFLLTPIHNFQSC